MKPHPFTLAFLLLAATSSLAAPPTLSNVLPRSGQRGVPVTVILTGANLTPATRLSLPFKAEQKHLADPKPNLAQIRLQMKVDPSVAPGIYPIRVVNEEGVSSITFFRVDTLPIGAEIEDNNTLEKAQKIPWPVAVEGQCAGGDVDHFRFPARKGQRLTVEVESARLGSGVLPQIRVTDAARKFIASDDSQSLAGDVRVTFTVPADGDYIIELSDSRYRGGNPAHYRLRIGEFDVFEEVFPLGGQRGQTVTFTLRGGTLARPVSLTRKLETTAPHSARMQLSLEGAREGALPPFVAVGELPERIVLHKDDKGVEIKTPLVVNGRFDRAGQVERFRFPVTAGSRWRLAVLAEQLGSRLDGVLRVLDDKGRQLALTDDTDLPPPAPGQPGQRTVDPTVEVTVPAGVTALVVELRDQRDRGGIGFAYRLTIEPVTNDFSVSLGIGELNVPRGGTVALSVPVVRRGYDGPIRLVVHDLPMGFSVQGGNVPAGGSVGVLTVRADTMAGGEPMQVSVEGVASIAGAEVRRPARQRVIAAREAGAAGLIELSRLTLARTSAVPFRIEPPATLTLVKGYPTEVPVKLIRDKGPATEKLAIAVTAVVPGQPAGPAGFTLRPAAASAAAEARFSITPGVNVPEGSADLAVTATARVGAQQLSLAAPVAVMIKAPFAIQVGVTSPLKLPPGETVKLTGKVLREAVCKAPVRLTLAGLPAGVSLVGAAPTVAATANDFAIELRINPKAALAKGTLTLTAQAAVNGMNYTAPVVSVEAVVGK